MAFTATMLLVGLTVMAQDVHNGQYLYRGKLVDVPINSRIVLAYFRTSQMNVTEIRRNYNCLRTISLSGDKADTLYACEVELGTDSYDEEVMWLREKAEVYDVEPVIGTETRAPVSNVFYVKLFNAGDTVLLKNETMLEGVNYEGVAVEGLLWYKVSVNKKSAYNALALSTQIGVSGLFDQTDPGFVFEIEQYDNCVSDASFDDQWGMNAINACDAWDISTGSSSIKVAIIDQGIDISHSEFNHTNVSSSFDVMSNTSPSVLWGDHGTHVAGIIFANHNEGEVAGVAPDVSLIDISDTIEGLAEECFLRLSTAFYEAVSRGADVISCSWGSGVPSETSTSAPLLEDAIYYALENGRSGKGCVVVFSSGNYVTNVIPPQSFVRYPAYAIEDIIVVGAIQSNYTRSPFSCFGIPLDVVAPGSSIYSTIPNQGYDSWNGTSMAAPHVSGLAALMLSVNSNLTNTQVDRIIKGTAQKIGSYSYDYSPNQPIGSWDMQVGHGLIDAAAAVEQAQNSLNKDLFVKDASDDNGTEPNTTSVSVTVSPDIKAYLPGTSTEVSAMEYGNTYTISVTIHNPTSSIASLPVSKIKVYWSAKSPTYWNGSWSNNSSICGSPLKGVLTFSGFLPVFIPANGTATVNTTLNVPLYETTLCTPLTKPSTMNLVAVIDDGTLIVGEQASDYPIELFARDNNNIAIHNYSIIDPLPPLPPHGSGEENTGISITPNPSSGSVTIGYELPEGMTSANLFLANSYGQLQYNETVYSNNKQITVQNLPTGVYNVILEHNGVLLGESVLIVK